MPLTINTNSAAASANYHLSRNQSALQKSLTRLSSGSRIVQPVDDAGGLAVSMKLESSIVRLGGGAKKRPKRHFLSRSPRRSFGFGGQNPKPDGRVEGLSQGVMKNASDSENYNREFKDLQMQIHDMATLEVQRSKYVRSILFRDCRNRRKVR